jgi:hypothetical protein
MLAATASIFAPCKTSGALQAATMSGKVSKQMSKANSVYIMMLVAFAIGLWTIVSLGSIYLHAPPDLAGKWELRPAKTSETTTPAHILSIQQSGRFLQIDLDGKNHPFKMISHQIVQAPTGLDELHIELAAANFNMTFHGRANSDAFSLQTHGILEGNWNALRVVRTYPRKLADQPATKPAADHAH